MKKKMLAVALLFCSTIAISAVPAIAGNLWGSGGNYLNSGFSSDDGTMAANGNLDIHGSGHGLSLDLGAFQHTLAFGYGDNTTLVFGDVNGGASTYGHTATANVGSDSGVQVASYGGVTSVVSTNVYGQSTATVVGHHGHH